MELGMESSERVVMVAGGVGGPETDVGGVGGSSVDSGVRFLLCERNGVIV